MERLIEWFNAGEMTITDNKVFSCHTILEIDNLSFIDDQVNIMAGDIDLYIRADDFEEKPDGLYYVGNRIDNIMGRCYIVYS